MTRRVVVAARGGPSVLTLREVPTIEPRAGQVRIDVRRASVAFGDRMRREGVLAPWGEFTPGYDVVGVVGACGPGAEAWRGRRVACLMPTPGLGGYADQVVVDARWLVAVPDAVGDDDAAALGMNYVTAWQIVHRVLALGPGASLLVHGASGGVGSAISDVARATGVQVIGTASAHKHAALEARGVVPIDRRGDVAAAVTALGGVDAVADPIGGENLEISARALRPGGTVVMFGVTGELARGWWALGDAVCRVARLAARVRVRPYGFGLTTRMATARDDLGTVIAEAEAGRLKPLIGEVVPLSEVVRAHDLLDAGAATGRILLDPTR